MCYYYGKGSDYLICALDNLSPKELKLIKKHAVERIFSENETIFDIGDKPEFLYLLLKGEVYICDTSLEGHRTIVTIISEINDCFGEVYLYNEMPYTYYAVAAKEAKIMCIPKQYLVQFPQFSYNMNKILASKAFKLSQKLQLLLKDSLQDKILEYLEKHQSVELKRYELADYLGVSRPALSKAIYQMVDKELIEIGEHGKLILKR